MSTKYQSHGEVLSVYSIDALKQAKDCVVLLDEPETALSVRNQFRLANEAQRAVERNCQLFLSTHCIPLIESVDEVLSLDKKKWVSSTKFIEGHRKKASK